MGQKDGEKWGAAADLQPTTPKSDRLLEPNFAVACKYVAEKEACDFSHKRV
jgi:hypothetical protein